MVLWGRSVLGRQKVPPRSHQGCATFVVSLVFWGRSILGHLGCQKVLWKVPPSHQGCPRFVIFLVFWGRSSWAAKRFRGRFHQGSSSFVVSLVLWGRSVLGCQKVPSQKVLWKVHQGSTKVAQVSWSLWSSGADLFWGAKIQKVLWKVPPLLPQTCLPVPQLFFCIVFSANSLSFGVFSHSKRSWGKMTRFFWGSLQQMASASQKVLWSVPQTVLYIGLTVCRGFFCKWLLLQKRFCGGVCQLCFTFISQSPPGVKVAWIVDMSHPYKSRPQKTTHDVVAVGVFFGLVPRSESW